MSWGELATRINDAARSEPVRMTGFQQRDLAQVIPGYVSWYESGSASHGLALPAVWSCVRLIAATVDQLEVRVQLGDRPATIAAPSWLRFPRRYGSALDLGDLVQYIVTAQLLRGAAYLRCIRVGESWRLDVLHNDSVQVQRSTSGVVSLRYLVDGEEMEHVPAIAAQWREGQPCILPIPYLVVPDHPEGIGPVQAMRQALEGYAKAESEAANLLDGGKAYQGGILTTDQEISATTAERYQDRWESNRKLGKIPVLGSGLRYDSAIGLKPSDAQWLESRAYSTAIVAAAFGIPPSYLGLSLIGGQSSLSYSNAQDSDRQYRRAAVAPATNQIANAVSLLLPPGRNPAEETRLVFDYTRWAGEQPTTGTVPDGTDAAAPEEG